VTGPAATPARVRADPALVPASPGAVVRASRKGSAAGTGTGAVVGAVYCAWSVEWILGFWSSSGGCELGSSPDGASPGHNHPRSPVRQMTSALVSPGPRGCTWNFVLCRF
jgi:hypothetical protein